MADDKPPAGAQHEMPLDEADFLESGGDLSDQPASAPSPPPLHALSPSVQPMVRPVKPMVSVRAGRAPDASVDGGLNFLTQHGPLAVGDTQPAPPLPDPDVPTKAVAGRTILGLYPAPSESKTDSVPVEVLAEPVPVRLMQALKQPVQIGARSSPLWAFFAAVGCVIAVLIGLMAALLGAGVASAGRFADQAGPASSSSNTGAASRVSTPPERAPGSLVELAASGQAGAIQQIDAMQPSERRIEEAVARAKGRQVRAQQNALDLRRRLQENATLIKDHAVLESLQDFAQNEATAVTALDTMAHLPGPISVELLYEVWTGTRGRDATTELAEALVYSKDVLPKATPALRVAIDLRRAQTCEENLAILPRATKDGDSRSLHLLAKLQRTYGCGPKKKDDCYKCLREGTVLEDATRAVRDRRPPKL